MTVDFVTLIVSISINAGKQAVLRNSKEKVLLHEQVFLACCGISYGVVEHNQLTGARHHLCYVIVNSLSTDWLHIQHILCALYSLTRSKFRA